MQFFRRKDPKKEKKEHDWNKAIDDNLAELNGNADIKKEYIVTLNTVNKVNRFANICQSAPVKVTIYDESGVAVPGDSIMGIFAMSLLRPVRMDVEGIKRDVSRFISRIMQDDIAVSDDPGTEGE